MHRGQNGSQPVMKVGSDLAALIGRLDRYQQGELVAADAAEAIAPAYRCRCPRRERSQHGVAGCVAVAIVETLEVVHVDRREQKRALDASGSVNHLLGVTLKRRLVHCPGHHVPPRHIPFAIESVPEAAHHQGQEQRASEA